MKYLKFPHNPSQIGNPILLLCNFIEVGIKKKRLAEYKSASLFLL